MNYCILIPTYNNDGTLTSVIDRSLAICNDVIVVNDGSTDNTGDLLKAYEGKIDVVEYVRNRGKGYALKCGLRRAKERGFRYAITLDSDGQHFPEDAVLLIDKAKEREGRTLIVGCRNLTANGMPRENTFANKFSNFWFRVQTGIDMPDTQSGYRLYDLDALPSLAMVTNRYESELELLVFSAWRGVKIKGAPVRVYYAPEGERVSHFRPFMDFFRISVLNTILCFAAVLYGYPRMGVEKIKDARRVRKALKLKQKTIR